MRNAPESPLVPRRVRLDQLLVQRSLAPSRERGQVLIPAGGVRVNGERMSRSADSVRDDAEITLDAGPRFVSRGGEKLAGALDELHLDVRGRVVLDIGSSTGGFTHFVLQRGAARVDAGDVGEGQLDWELRDDARVGGIEGGHPREGGTVPEQVGPLVADAA